MAKRSMLPLSQIKLIGGKSRWNNDGSKDDLLSFTSTSVSCFVVYWSTLISDVSESQDHTLHTTTAL